MKTKLNYFVLDDAGEVAIREAIASTITQSEIMTRAACPRKWYYRYALKLDKLGAPNYHLIYGTMMHAALAKLYDEGHYGETPIEYPIEIPKIVIPEETIMSPQDLAEMKLVKAKVQIMFDAYRFHYYKVDSHMRVGLVEKELTAKWRGLTLQGRIDMAAYPNNRDGLYIWDWKTAGRFDASMLDAWSFRFQFLYYAWLYWKVTGKKPAGIMANGIAKSLLRPKIVDKKLGTKETVAEYLARIRLNVRADRERFFYRQRMPFIDGTLEKFENEILGPHLDSFILLSEQKKSKGFDPAIVNSLAMAMNTGHCHVYNSFCEYLPLCKDGPIMLGEYNVRDVKHQELDTEAEIGEL